MGLFQQSVLKKYLWAKLLELPMVFTEVENSILENNLYGVDINDESVEIARLSLWLRTAQKGRKLTSLSSNIKCGNSLIDDPAVIGEKAFHWPTEFPEVFRKKEKKAWHITTATHNSRYSQRMYDNYVKLGDPVWLSEKEELIVTGTIADIAVNDKLNIVAYNICGDHMHLLLVCEEAEVPKIVGKLKSMSARACNIAMGRTTRGHAPLSGSSPERVPGSDTLPPDTRASDTPGSYLPVSDTFPPDSSPAYTSLSRTSPTCIPGSDIPVSDTFPSDSSPAYTSLSGSSPERVPGSDTLPSDTPGSDIHLSDSSPTYYLLSEDSPGFVADRGETQAHLWTQKFGCKEITGYNFPDFLVQVSCNFRFVSTATFYIFEDYFMKSFRLYVSTCSLSR